MRLDKYRFHLIVIVFSIVVFCLSQCATKEQEKSTILLATNTRALTDVKFKATKERIKRGQYLTNGILMCFSCHSPRDTTKPGFPPVESKKGSGAVLYDTEEERLVAPNITPDVETGAVTWTDDMFARAIREGIGHDGRVLSEPMYWKTYRELTDEDLTSVVVYLRTLTPVKNKLPKRRLSLENEKKLQTKAKPLLHAIEAPDLSDMVIRGRYLIKVANCAGCHTSWSKSSPGIFGGGDKIQRLFDTSFVFSSNITPHSTGLQGWSTELFMNVIRTGKGGILDPVMPWVDYQNINDEDLKAILMALQQVPAVNHKVMNGIEATFCDVCEQWHGYGKHNKILPLKRIPFDASVFPDFVGTYRYRDGYYFRVTLENKMLLIDEGEGPIELVPVSQNRFQALGFSTPVSFKRDASGKVKWLISYGIDEDILVKQETPLPDK